MTTRARVMTIGVTAAILALPSAAVSEPVKNATVISIEGKAGNMLAPTAVAMPQRTPGMPVPTTTVRDSTRARNAAKISSLSVLNQLLTAGPATDTRVVWRWYASFNAPYVIALDRVGPKGADGWNYRVNSLYWGKGANMVNLGNGDRVTWYWGAWNAAVLEIAEPTTGSSPTATVGSGSMRVVINQVNWKRTRVPAAGATVTYAGQTATTDASGAASFTAVPGRNVIRATKSRVIAATLEACLPAGGTTCTT